MFDILLRVIIINQYYYIMILAYVLSETNTYLLTFKKICIIIWGNVVQTLCTQHCHSINNVR